MSFYIFLIANCFIFEQERSLRIESMKFWFNCCLTLCVVNFVEESVMERFHLRIEYVLFFHLEEIRIFMKIKFHRFDYFKGIIYKISCILMKK